MKTECERFKDKATKGIGKNSEKHYKTKQDLP